MTDEQPRDRTAELEARLAELERRTESSSAPPGGRSGVEAAFWAVMHSVFPDEARRHLKAATREQLMAARVYLDRWIAQLDETSDEDAVRSRERIEIE